MEVDGQVSAEPRTRQRPRAKPVPRATAALERLPPASEPQKWRQCGACGQWGPHGQEVELGPIRTSLCRVCGEKAWASADAVKAGQEVWRGVQSLLKFFGGHQKR